jgi:two-component system, response regulator, stage 0 sporulation protein F
MFQILVIDDDTIMNSVIVQMLKMAGYKTKSAVNGKRGLKLLDSRRFDLIITDIVMPELRGTEMIQVIRAINKAIPIIAISGEGNKGPETYLSTAQAFGANYTFQKPFRGAPFLEAVRDCLAGTGTMTHIATI